MTQLKSSGHGVVYDSHEIIAWHVFFLCRGLELKGTYIWKGLFTSRTGQEALQMGSQGPGRADSQEGTSSHLPPGLCQEHCLSLYLPLFSVSLMPAN